MLYEVVAQRRLISLFKVFVILERYQRRQHNNCGKSLIYNRVRSGPRIDPLGSLQFNIPASWKAFSTATKKIPVSQMRLKPCSYSNTHKLQFSKKNFISYSAKELFIDCLAALRAPSGHFDSDILTQFIHYCVRSSSCRILPRDSYMAGSQSSREQTVHLKARSFQF